MRGYKININAKAHKNKGFTLVELIISIAVLVIIMLPLMNNFYRSAQMNKKAEDLQVQSNLAASIMEGLKSLNIEDTIKQFTGLPADFSIITVTDDLNHLMIDDIKVLKFDGTSYSAVNPDEYNTLDGQSTYYFAINGMKAGSTAYDALITMKSEPYKNDTDKILNSYPMPDAINLDEMANGLVFSDGVTAGDIIDNQALTTFVQWGTAYAQSLFYSSPDYLNYLADYDSWKNECEIAKMQPTPMPTPTPYPEVTFSADNYKPYCNEDEVVKYIRKTMKITVTATNVVYETEYNCTWPAGSNIGNTLRYTVSEKNYPRKLANIYLFYNQSVFSQYNSDIIVIDNEMDNETQNSPLNFYLAQQDSGNPQVVIHANYKYDSNKVSVFTNIPSSGSVSLLENGYTHSENINPGIVKSAAKDRIYDTNITIYKYVASENASDKYKEKLYSLSSATENNENNID